MKNFWNFCRANFNQRSFFYSITFLLLSLMFFSQGCKKEINSIGLDLKDPNDLLNATFTDTVTLTAYSATNLYLKDTLNTTGLVFNYLGCINDPVFGTTTASIYTQLVPSSYNINFDKSAKLDSIVLTLRYTGGFYGDTLNSFAIKVYELKENMSDKIYYQNNTIAYKQENLAGSAFYLTPKPKTKVKVDTLLEPHIRIRLSDELGNLFLKNADKTKTAEIFKEFFKGLYISAEPFRNGGCLVNFSLVNALSGIQLYYKPNDTAKQQQFSYIISNTDAVRFNNYQHNYEAGNPNFVAQVLNKDTVKGEKMLYVQSMGGVKTKIAFPNIKVFKKINEGKIVINKAELVITNIGEDLDLYPNPVRLNIQAVNPSGKLVIIPDAITGSSTYFGGGYDEKSKQYRFRITRYIQSIIQKEDYQPFIYLVADGAAAYANRLILNGTKPTDGPRLRLEIYYTEY